MKALGPVNCQVPKNKYRRASHEHIEIPNHLSRQFAVAEPNKVWVGDVTYVWMRNRWMYLAVVIDLFARKTIGWAMSLYKPKLSATIMALSDKAKLISTRKLLG